MVKERMDWILEWEREKGPGANAESRDRTMPRVGIGSLECEMCGRVCKFTIHKWMHEVSTQKKSVWGARSQQPPHCGAKSGRFGTSDHTLSHELGSEQASERMSAAERASKASRAEEENE